MAATARTTSKRVWDPLVRLTHWTIALAVVVNAIFLRDGTVAHVWIGYAALSALILRLLWGVIAPGPARLTDMPLAPTRAIAHLRDLVAGRWHPGPGHTPLGAWMAVVLWSLLAVTSITGLSLEADPFPDDETHHSWSEYRYGHDDDDDDDDDDDGDHLDNAAETIEDLHEATATALLVLAALHVAGVGLESRLSGINLAKGMIGGRSKRTRS
jgi:cytochrome b